MRRRPQISAADPDVPVALAEISLQGPPWEVALSNGAGIQTLLRLLYRQGILTSYQPDGHTGDALDTFHAGRISSRLLGFDSVEGARENLLAFETMFGRNPDPRLDWIRETKSFAASWARATGIA